MRVRVHFACCECGRLISRSGPSVRLPSPPLCRDCLMVPGWFRSLARRLTIDPHHPGTEPQLWAVPTWEPAR